MSARVVVLIIASCLLLGYIAIGLVFYRIAIARTDKKFLSHDPSLPDSVRENDDPLGKWWEAQEKREERIRSSDGLNLVADYLPASKPDALAFILVHGYSGTGPTMKRFARIVRERFDCAVLTPDLRGHGRSEGTYIGFGLRDAEDLHLWVNRLIELRGKDVKIVLLGASMGGAAVLTATGMDLPPNVVCVISDCGYSNARDILSYKIKKMYGLPAFPVVNAVASMTSLLAGFRLNDASPREAVKRASVPILFIHGEADDFVPVEMAHELYAAAPGEKKLFIVPGAGHAESCKIAGKNYDDLVESFVGAALARSSS